MTEWLAALSGDPTDLRTLAEISGADWGLTEEAGVFYLRSRSFSGRTNSEEVMNRAVALIQAINGALKVYRGDFQPVEVDHIVEVSDDGTRRRHLWNAITLEGRVAIKVAAGEPPEPIPVPLWAGIALEDPKGAKALRLFTITPSWINLYNILEVIQEDVKNPVAKLGWASASEVSRFTATANNARVLGDEARHGHERFDPPPNPMTLPEAREFIRGLLERWLRSKAGSP